METDFKATFYFDFDTQGLKVEKQFLSATMIGLVELVFFGR